ncbi:MAG: hypothetical protein EHM78_02195 [Myxococcaceae bacterium]|nr:MAG: hypothetical protein EHM78_02195 [Myxococcaceae bacterium]
MQIIDNDALGLKPMTAFSGMSAAAMVTAGPAKIMGFQQFVDSALTQNVLEHDGRYLAGYVERAFEKGLRFADRNTRDLNVARSPENHRDRVDTIVQSAFVELQGISEAVSQNLVRAAADGILSKKNANLLLRAMYSRIDKVGGTRIDALADTIVMRTFNEGSLSSYESVGVTEVGIIPEVRKIRRPAQDAVSFFEDKKRKFNPNTGAGSKVSRTTVPHRETVRRIRKAQEAIEKLKRVNVLTAGDDEVCPECEDIAEEGPYRINVARSLIPAHPHCRCVFVPARDRRFTTEDL